jgi:hypothetical protein
MTAVSQAGLIVKGSGGEAAEAGVLAAPNPVFDAGVGAVPGVQKGQLPGGGVGGEALVAPAVAVLERVELGAGVRAFSADQHPGAGWVAGQRGGGQQAGSARRPWRRPGARRHRPSSPPSATTPSSRSWTTPGSSWPGCCCRATPARTPPPTTSPSWTRPVGRRRADLAGGAAGCLAGRDRGGRPGPSAPQNARRRR